MTSSRLLNFSCMPYKPLKVQTLTLQNLFTSKFCQSCEILKIQAWCSHHPDCILRLSFRGFTIALVIDFFYSGGMMIKKETVKIFKTIQRRRCNFLSCLGANLSSSNPAASIPKPQHTRNYISRYLVKMLMIRNDKFCWNL